MPLRLTQGDLRIMNAIRRGCIGFGADTFDDAFTGRTVDILHSDWLTLTTFTQIELRVAKPTSRICWDGVTDRFSDGEPPAVFLLRLTSGNHRNETLIVNREGTHHCVYIARVNVVAGEPAEIRDLNTVARAAATLRYLADYARPVGVDKRFTGEHLHQLAGELENLSDPQHQPDQRHSETPVAVTTAYVVTGSYSTGFESTTWEVDAWTTEEGAKQRCAKLEAAARDLQQRGSALSPAQPLKQQAELLKRISDEAEAIESLNLLVRDVGYEYHAITINEYKPA